MAKNERRGRTATERGATSNDRIDNALKSAARWLKRRGARREKKATRQAYTAAASVIMNRLTR